MHLTSFTDFGLRALILLAKADGELLTAAAIADYFGVSRHHMAKVLRQLAAGGFVDSQRGPHGGVRLAREPKAICIGEVVRKLEGEQPLVQCWTAQGTGCRLLPGCRLPGMLWQAESKFLEELDAYSLADCLVGAA